jgi:lipopolysaccharide cholinephosphotransferase
MTITSENLRKIQILELKILVEIKRICDKHNISFILAEGTLLGAIRHKGFIPWDDDIDIAMTRENFDKFCNIAPSELSDEYFLQTPSTDKQYGDYCLARVRLKETKYITEREPINMINNGFRVDVFSMDNIPDSYLFGYIYWTKFCILMRVYWSRKGYHHRSENIFVRLVTKLGIILCLPLSTKKIKNILENYHKKYERLNVKYIALLRGGWGFKKLRHLSSIASKIIYVPFENINMPIPANYHLYLSKQYGEYMIPPPIESRKLRHAVDIDFGKYNENI